MICLTLVKSQLNSLPNHCFIIFTLIIYEQATNYFKIIKNEIQFKNGLKTNTIELDSSMKAIMKAETVYTKMSSQAGSGSYWRTVVVFLINSKGEFQLLDFQLEDKYAFEANILATEIVESINKRIKACNIKG